MAAIISAYNDGREIVTKIRERRRLRQAPSPSQLLDTSLEEAAHDIEREKSRGVTRFGPVFEVGDEVSILQLRQIGLELKAQLFEQLVPALRDDDMTDFRPAVRTSDLGRDYTVTTLMELSQRLMVAAPIERMPMLQPKYAFPPRPMIQPAEMPDHIVEPLRRASAPQTSSLSVVAPHGKAREHGREKLSYFPSFSLRSIVRGTRDKMAGSSQVEQTASTSLSQTYSNPDGPSSRVTTPDINGQWTSPMDDTTSVWRTLEPVTAQSSSPQPDLTYIRGLSYPKLLPTPSAENDYLGFCIGAWKLQCGAQDALKQKLEFSPGWSGSEVRYLGCGSSKCVFAYRLPTDQFRKVWHSSKGVSFRWQFLAKSHVAQNRADHERYAYQCVFCILTGEKPVVWQGVDTLLQHVSRHRGQMIPPEVLHRTQCISDRVAGDEELEWDVNLRPLGHEADYDLRQDYEVETGFNPWQT